MTGSIPNLKFDCGTIDIDCSNFLKGVSQIRVKKKAATYKVNTNRADEGLRKSIVSKTEEKRGFTDTRVTDQQKFKEIITRDVVKKNNKKETTHTILDWRVPFLQLS